MASLSRAARSSLTQFAGAAMAATALLAFASTPALAESTNCSLYAATGGSDSAPGTSSQPFATIAHLAGALSAGQVGCARGGTYTQDVTISHGGNAGAPLTITSYPGERATLIGRLYLREGANYVTIANMNLNGKNAASLPSPTINANNSTFIGDDVTDEHTEICFVVGSTWGHAKATVITRNRIHDCGPLPSNNQAHGIYVEQAEETQITENVIYNNTDRGIQLYPNAQGTLVEHNIINANGEGIIFSGSSGTASGNNTVRNNLITNAVIRYDIESWYPAGNPIGQGNTVQTNCLWGGAQGTIQTPETGYTASGNINANPAYSNPATGDYRVNSTSPCAALIQGTSIPTQPFNSTSEGPLTPPAGGQPAGGAKTEPPSSGSGHTETPGSAPAGASSSASSQGSGSGSPTPTSSPSTPPPPPAVSAGAGLVVHPHHPSTRRERAAALRRHRHHAAHRRRRARGRARKR